jgi:hypothetical protein
MNGLNIREAKPPQNGDASIDDNYRGITQVNTMSKIFTSILNNRMSDGRDKHNIIRI